MTVTRSLALATAAAAGLVGLAQPASAAASSDYDVWRANYGSTGGGSAASFDGDGDVDGHDFLLWQRG